jgi:DNA ligase-1
MATEHFKPLLAAKCEDLSQLRYPVYVCPKLDGIRALVIDGVLVSRTLKPIPNKELQDRYGRPEYNGLDGELILGSATAHDVFNKTTSCVMTREADAHQVVLWVFDVVDDSSYEDRLRSYVNYRTLYPNAFVHVPYGLCTTQQEVEHIEQACVNQGYEGIMIRDPKGRYKMGRSTLKEQILLKFKRFETSEAVILRLEEKMHNDNAATTDELGYTKRSSHIENQRPAGTLGSLVVQDTYTGCIFNIGTGFTDADRGTIWSNPNQYIGKVVSYQHFPIGVVDKPRFPSYRGIRNAIDLGE